MQIGVYDRVGGDNVCWCVGAKCAGQILAFSLCIFDHIAVDIG